LFEERAQMVAGDVGLARGLGEVPAATTDEGVEIGGFEAVDGALLRFGEGAGDVEHVALRRQAAEAVTFAGEIAGRDHAVLTKRGGARDDVAQLADVAGPLALDEALHRFFGDGDATVRLRLQWLRFA